MRVCFYFLVLLLKLSVFSQHDEVNKVIELISIDRDSAFACVNQLLNEGTLDDYSKSKAFYARGYLRESNNRQAALWDYLEAVRFLNLSNRKDDDARSGLYNNIAKIYKKHSSYDLALKFYYLSLDICTYDDRKKILLNIGNALKSKGQYADAVVRYLEALEYCKNDLDLQSIVYGQLAVVYYHIGSYDKSSEYLYRIINLADQLKPSRIAKAYHRLGVNYERAGDQLKAIEYFKIAVKKREGKDRLISFQDLAELYVDVNQYEKAITACESAEKYINELNPSPVVFELYKIKADAYYELGRMSDYKVYMDLYAKSHSEYDSYKTKAQEGGEKQLILALTEKHEEAIREQENKKENLRLILIASVLLLITTYLSIVLIRKYIKKKQVEREIASIQQRYNRLS